MSGPSTVFVAREDWQGWLAANPDMDQTGEYDQWRQRVKEFGDEIVRLGNTFNEVPVTPDQYLAWCERNDMKPGQEARNFYAAFQGKDKPKPR